MGNLSVRCWEAEPGAALAASSRRSSASMSSSRLFLGGLRSRRARLRFTGRHQNAIKWSRRSRVLQRTANRVLTVCLSQGGNPKLLFTTYLQIQRIPNHASDRWRNSALIKITSLHHSFPSNGRVRSYSVFLPCSAAQTAYLIHRRNCIAEKLGEKIPQRCLSGTTIRR
jgi:hypothetical protein